MKNRPDIRDWFPQNFRSEGHELGWLTSPTWCSFFTFRNGSVFKFGGWWQISLWPALHVGIRIKISNWRAKQRDGKLLRTKWGIIQLARQYLAMEVRRWNAADFLQVKSQKLCARLEKKSSKQKQQNPREFVWHFHFSLSKGGYEFSSWKILLLCEWRKMRKNLDRDHIQSTRRQLHLPCSSRTEHDPWLYTKKPILHKRRTTLWESYGLFMKRELLMCHLETLLQQSEQAHDGKY